MGAEVEVTEGEPLRDRAVCRQFALDAVALVRAPPALPLVDPTAEGVDERVEVWADPQAEEGDVVAGVDDDRQLGVGHGRLQAAKEPRAADAAGEGDDLHAV